MTLSVHFVIRNKCCKSYDVSQRSYYTRRKTVKIDKDIAKGKNNSYYWRLISFQEGNAVETDK